MPYPREIRDFLDPAVVGRFESLEIVARAIVSGFLRGHHRSAAKGTSMEFLEHRPYVPGDEVRRLDWRTYAKTDRFYLKQYEDETNLRATLVIDASASMGFGTAGITKLRYAGCLAAAFGYLLLRQRDAVGLALVDTSVRELVPPRATAEHLSGIFSTLEGAPARGRTALGSSLQGLARRIPSRSLVLVFSDFLDDPREVLAGFSRLRHQRSEVIAFHLMDPAELDLPFSGWTVFQDAEDPQSEVRLDVRQVSDVYRRNLEEHCDTLRKGSRAAEVDYSLTRITEPFETVLTRHLALRKEGAGRSLP